MMKKILSVFLAGAFSLSGISNSCAAATQADVDYSTKISQTIQTFSTNANEWAAALSSAPTFAVGSKFKAYKERASKSSEKFLVTIKKLKSFVASPGFTKSGPMLLSTMALYEKAVAALQSAINKNDTKAISKAGQISAQANKALVAWQKAYTADVAALNS